MVRYRKSRAPWAAPTSSPPARPCWCRLSDRGQAEGGRDRIAERDVDEARAEVGRFDELIRSADRAGRSSEPKAADRGANIGTNGVAGLAQPLDARADDRVGAVATGRAASARERIRPSPDTTAARVCVPPRSSARTVEGADAMAMRIAPASRDPASRHGRGCRLSGPDGPENGEPPASEPARGSSPRTRWRQPPILNTFVPHFGQVPDSAGLPFFMVI